MKFNQTLCLVALGLVGLIACQVLCVDPPLLKLYNQKMGAFTPICDGEVQPTDELIKDFFFALMNYHDAGTTIFNRVLQAYKDYIG